MLNIGLLSLSFPLPYRSYIFQNKYDANILLISLSYKLYENIKCIFQSIPTNREWAFPTTRDCRRTEMVVILHRDLRQDNGISKIK